MRYIFQFEHYNAKTIPVSRTYTVFDMSGTKINGYRLQHVDCSHVISKIPRNYRTLNVSDSVCRQLNIEDLQVFLGKIPSHIKKLVLSKNDLCSKDDNIFEEIIHSIPHSVEEIELGRDEELNGLKVSMLLKRFCTVDLSASHLDFKALSTYFLFHPLPEDCAIRQLNLSSQKLLYLQQRSHFIAWVGSLASLTMIHLSNNELHTWTIDERLGLVKSLSPRLQTLDLSCNSLYAVGANGLIDIMQAMPKSVHTFILDNNQLHTVDYLRSVFASIPDHIHIISLNRNYLGYIEESSLIALMGSIPSHIQKINLKNNYFETNKRKQDQKKLQQQLIAIAPSRSWCFSLYFADSAPDLVNMFLVFLAAKSQSSNGLTALPIEMISCIAEYLMPEDSRIDVCDLLQKIQNYEILRTEEGRLVNIPQPAVTVSSDSSFSKNAGIMKPSSLIDQCSELKMPSGDYASFPSAYFSILLTGVFAAIAAYWVLGLVLAMSVFLCVSNLGFMAMFAYEYSSLSI